MSCASIVFEILAGTAIVIVIAAVITLLITGFNSSRDSQGMIFLGRLSNTDSSINHAMNYLELTNSVVDKMDGKV
jgi:hypothetical protein